jgi:ABC-type branched-subunit amino acid transport system ATPase component
MRILEVVSLTRRFAGRTALDAVSFTAEEGETLGLFGPAGAGKTTCLDCLTGALRPDAGRVILDGREITGETAHRIARAGMARTFQRARPFRGLSALANVAVALGGRGPWALAAALGLRPGPVTRASAQALLDRAGLAPHAGRRAGDLSPALLKRLEIARALALAPRLVLLDEPFGGLADDEARGLAELIRSLRAGGLTVVIAERDAHAPMDLVDRVVVLDRGAVVAAGPPGRLRPSPRPGDARSAPGGAGRSPRPLTGPATSG